MMIKPINQNVTTIKDKHGSIIMTIGVGESDFIDKGSDFHIPDEDELDAMSGEPDGTTDWLD